MRKVALSAMAAVIPSANFVLPIKMGSELFLFRFSNSSRLLVKKGAGLCLMMFQ